MAVESVELVGPAKSFGSGYTNLADAGRPKSKTRTANEVAERALSAIAAATPSYSV